MTGDWLVLWQQWLTQIIVASSVTVLGDLWVAWCGNAVRRASFLVVVMCNRRPFGHLFGCKQIQIVVNRAFGCDKIQWNSSALTELIWSEVKKIWNRWWNIAHRRIQRTPLKPAALQRRVQKRWGKWLASILFIYIYLIGHWSINFSTSYNNWIAWKNFIQRQTSSLKSIIFCWLSCMPSELPE